MFLLPDRGPGLELVDEEPTRFEGGIAVDRRYCHCHRRLADRDFPDPVLNYDRNQLPLARSFGDEFLELVDDDAVICLVFEMSDSGLPLRMVAGGPEKEHHRTCRRVTYFRQESGRIESFEYDRDSFPYCWPFHRLGVYGAPPILYFAFLASPLAAFC